MKRLVTVVFVIFAVVLTFLFIKGEPEETQDNVITRAKTITPISGIEEQENTSANKVYAEDSSLISLIPLRSDETLLNTLGIDFDSDGYDDQINAIKKTNNPYIFLLIGLYNPFRGQYDRTTEIKTEIIQTQTFSFTCMDIIGNHTNTLIYSGFSETGESIMKIFLPQKSGNNFSIDMIGDFRSDGSIFVQQLDRYDSYEAQQATGVSFPVWVYSSDAFTGGNTLDQLQTMYVWNQTQRRFVKSTENRVVENKVASKELSRIQDGTVETFTGHLNGLWYKTSTTSEKIRYIFFNPENKEIIFQTDDSQEVYTWVSSTLRRNGIYLSAVNSSINNLTRLIDISLTGIDEIKIRNQDDVRMPIKESNLWDGQYKKQTSKNVFTNNAEKKLDIQNLLEKQGKWLANGTVQIEFTDGKYNLNGKTGRIATSQYGQTNILQLKGTTEEPFFDHESFEVELDEDQPTTIRLAPVNITPLSIERIDLPAITLEAVQEKES